MMSAQIVIDFVMKLIIGAGFVSSIYKCTLSFNLLISEQPIQWQIKAINKTKISDQAVSEMLLGFVISVTSVNVGAL